MANNIKMYRKTATEIENTPISDGTVYFDTDNGYIYLDNGSTRKTYGRDDIIPNSTDEVTEILSNLQYEDEIYSVKTYDIKNQDGVVQPQRKYVLIGGGYTHDDSVNSITDIDIIREFTTSQFDNLSNGDSEGFQWTTDESDIDLTTNDVNYGDGYLTEKIVDLEQGISEITFTTLSDVNIDNTSLADEQILSYDGENWTNIDKITIDNTLTPTSENTFENKAFCDFMNNILPEATATGNPIAITNASGLNAKSLKVELEPIQDLNGYDKPWAGGSGKNKFNEQFAVRDFSSGRYCKWENGKLHFKNDGSGSFHTENVIISLPAGTYTLSAKNYNLVSGETPLYMFKINDGSLSYPSLTNPYNFTLEAPSTVDIRISTNGTTTASEFYTNIQLESGNSSTDYAPYSNICPISGRTQTTVSVNSEDTTVQFGQTVYGGEVDVTSGGTSDEWAKVDLGSIVWTAPSAEGISYSTRITDFKQVTTGQIYYGNAVLDNYNFVQSVLNNNDNGKASLYYHTGYSGYRLFVCDTNLIGKTAPQVATYMSGKYICYELATPTTLTTPATPISLNKGNNTLTADGDMELIYSKIPQ